MKITPNLKGFPRRRIRRLTLRRAAGSPPAPQLLIFDTGGGRTPTITSTAWHVMAKTGQQAEFMGYGSTGNGVKCDVVHAVTKTHITGRSDPVLLTVHHASLIKDKSENESLLTLMDMCENIMVGVGNSN